MSQKILVKAQYVCFLAVLLVLPRVAFSQADGRAMTFVDLMKFRQIKQVQISDDGAWVAFQEKPDRGDPTVVIQSTATADRFVIDRGSSPVFASNGMWAAAKIEPSFEDSEKSDKDDELKPGLAILDLASGQQKQFLAVDKFAFSKNGNWFARLHFRETDGVDSTAADTAAVAADTAAVKDPELGGLLVIQDLRSDSLIGVPDVRSFGFAEAGATIVYAIASIDTLRDGLYARELAGSPRTEVVLDVRPHGHYTEFSWTEDGELLAFLASVSEGKDKTSPASAMSWDGEKVKIIADSSNVPDGWMIPAKNSLRWTKDKERLFFGLRPVTALTEKGDDTDEAFDPYSAEAILEDREVDVWHWNDPRINSNQKMLWKKEQERVYAAVFYRGSENVVQLADLDVEGTGEPENERSMLGVSGTPYLKEITWVGEFHDLYHIDLKTGEKALVASRLVKKGASLSPDGKYMVYYRSPDWYVHEIESGIARNVTAGLKVSFADEDHDYPTDAPHYGLGGWVGEGDGVLINDKYDIWYVDLKGKRKPFILTAGEGRLEARTFRVIRTDPQKLFYEKGDKLLLSSYHNVQKNWGFYESNLGQVGVSRLLEEPKRFKFIRKAKHADRYLFSRSDYDEFPDLWIAGPDFKEPRKITDLDAQRDGIAWGKSELVEWTSLDGTHLQGVLIRPGNYDPSRRYPVLVYFYRFMSQLLHEFNEPVVNHRPSFPLYASNGYAIFLPDIRFELGRPGFSATKALVPGVQKLIDMGVADPNAIGLHGHSWSGYQAAFVATQTDMFSAIIAGAPVSNMTSAYGGIRWETGLARQFQYEMTQSRLGVSLWEGRDRYIENSPLFYLDRVNTPMLIQFGDEDGAVPWYQGIELYLGLRRNQKDAVFLQYRGEPHHLKKYPNKLDYSIKMKEYLDHYLKGEPAPDWISKGVLYDGK